MKLPPYGKSIDQSKEPVWIWAGERPRIHQTVKTFGKNMVAFYAPANAAEYAWFVKNRDVVVVHFWEPKNFWVLKLIQACLKSGANRIAEISWPQASCWWNPHYDTFKRYFVEILGVDDPLTITHYSRS